MWGKQFRKWCYLAAIVAVGGCASDDLMPLPQLVLEFRPKPSEFYESPQFVEIVARRKDDNSIVPFANIHFTMDGSDPGYDVGQLYYPGSIYLSGNGVYLIKAFADATRMESSGIMQAAYAIRFRQLAMPLFEPPPGVYVGDKQVKLTSPTQGAAIWYTTDGTDPRTSATRQLFSDSKLIPLKEEINKTVDYTIMAYTTMAGMDDSAVAVGLYSITSLGRCEGEYIFKCKAGKGELSDYRDPYNYHFNNQPKWRPENDPRFANVVTGRVWFQDWLGQSNDRYWMVDSGPNNPVNNLIDDQGTVIGHATLHICSFQHIAEQDAGWRVTNEAIASGWTETNDQHCSLVKAEYKPALHGSGWSYWEVVIERPDPVTGQVPPVQILYKKRNNT